MLAETQVLFARVTSYNYFCKSLLEATVVVPSSPMPLPAVAHLRCSGQSLSPLILPVVVQMDSGNPEKEEVKRL